MRKKYMIALALSLSLLTVRAADRCWALRIQNGATVPLSEVSYILSSSGAKSFTIVKKDAGQVSGVTDATVIRTDAGVTGIHDVQAADVPATVVQQVGNDLVIIGAESGLPVSIFTLDGKIVLRTATTESQTRVDISTLAPQTYVLRVGGTGVKFLKM